MFSDIYNFLCSFEDNWSQYSSIDPEELFKQFFDKTQQGQHSGFGDYAESTYGFAPASEVFDDSHKEVM